MNYKKFFIATFAGSITMWLTAGLWHEIIAAAFYSEETHATHEGTGIIFIAYLVLGLIMAYLYPKFSKGDKPLLDGIKFGAVIGILWVFPYELAMAGAHDTSIMYVLKNGAWHVVEQGIGGVVIAFLFSKLK